MGNAISVKVMLLTPAFRNMDLSYEEAAVVCGCAVGTIKSRVNRARNRLAEILDLDDEADFGSSDLEKAASAGGHLP